MLVKKIRKKTAGLLVTLVVLFALVAGLGLLFGCRYINNRLLQSNEATVTDLALLVKNNFQITDAEVAYMKSLTFNEMEVDPINQRLMDVGNGVVLHAAISNVYLLTLLPEEEYRYCTDEEAADFLGFGVGEALNGIWLLNGRIDENGSFQVAQRDDIYRYTRLTETELQILASREPTGTFTSDAWGSFITGYAPVYTVEGNFVGLLGIDMDPDRYQQDAQSMVTLILALFSLLALIMAGLFLIFYIKYTKTLELRRQFDFYSQMSHEIRTPMNSILGIAALSREETDPDVLRQNFAVVEQSGKHILKMVNQTLDYQKQTAEAPAETDRKETEGNSDERPTEALRGKRILLCEDHPLNARITSRLIERAGAIVDIAENGRTGLMRFAESPVGQYRAILMDIRMPEMDGLEATRKIRGLERSDAKTVPIIALTANAYQEDISDTKKAGMNAHLTKPVEPAALFRILADAMNPGSGSDA